MSSTENGNKDKGDAQKLNTKKNTKLHVYLQRQHPQQEVSLITILTHCQESEPREKFQSKDTDPSIFYSSAPSQDNSMLDDQICPQTSGMAHTHVPSILSIIFCPRKSYLIFFKL